MDTLGLGITTRALGDVDYPGIMLLMIHNWTLISFLRGRRPIPFQNRLRFLLNTLPVRVGFLIQPCLCVRFATFFTLFQQH